MFKLCLNLVSVGFSMLSDLSKSKSSVTKNAAFHFLIAVLLIYQAGDVEKNPGPLGPGGDASEPLEKKNETG